MTNTTRAPQQLGPTADPPNDSKDSTQLPNTIPVHVKATSVKKVNRILPYQALEPGNIELPLTMERYLDEAPNAGGATYCLVGGSRHRNVLDVLAAVDAEFGGDGMS